MIKEITLIFPSSPFLIDPLVFPPLGIMYLSSVLKENGIDTTLIDLSGYKELPEIKTEWVGISSTTPQYSEAKRIRDILHKKGHMVIIGGPHVSNTKDFNGFNLGVIGEGEKVLPHYLLGLDGNPYDDHIMDIDSIPFPDREGGHVRNYHYNIEGQRTTTILSSRGCPFSCGFCSSIWGKSVRFRSPENVYKEILECKEKYGFNSIMFFDDIFAINKKRIKKIADLVEPLHMKFRGFSRVDTADADLLLNLKRMGFVELGIGIETGSQELLNKNTKGITISQCERFIRLCYDIGLRVKAFFIVGLPGETHKTVEETREFIRRNNLHDIDVTILSPFPGSDIWNNTDKYDISFDKTDLENSFYKGKPGEYKSRVSTKELSAEQIVKYRDEIEQEFRPTEGQNV